MPAAPKVFISYSHDSEAHEDRVLDLANRLREDGIDAEIDQYETSPAEGWPTWCERRIKSAGFVLLVCTETYLRRVDGEEAPGIGHGVLWEARIIRQLLYDAGSVSARFVPVLFTDGSPDHIPTPVKGAARFVVDDEEEYERLCRLLTAQPRVLKPVLGKPKTLPPKERKSSGLAGVSSGTHPRVEEVFVGREADLKKLAAYLFPEDGRRRPVVVSGMAGVGKSYLVDRFYAENKDRFPGGYIRLALDPENLGRGGGAAGADRRSAEAAAGRCRRRRGAAARTALAGARREHRHRRCRGGGRRAGAGSRRVRTDRERAGDHARHGRVVADGAAAVVRR